MAKRKWQRKGTPKRLFVSKEGDKWESQQSILKRDTYVPQIGPAFATAALIVGLVGAFTLPVLGWIALGYGIVALIVTPIEIALDGRGYRKFKRHLEKLDTEQKYSPRYDALKVTWEKYAKQKEVLMDLRREAAKIAALDAKIQELGKDPSKDDRNFLRKWWTNTSEYIKELESKRDEMVSALKDKLKGEKGKLKEVNDYLGENEKIAFSFDDEDTIAEIQEKLDKRFWRANYLEGKLYQGLQNTYLRVVYPKLVKKMQKKYQKISKKLEELDKADSEKNKALKEQLRKGQDSLKKAFIDLYRTVAGQNLNSEDTINYLSSNEDFNIPSDAVLVDSEIMGEGNEVLFQFNSDSNSASKETTRCYAFVGDKALESLDATGFKRRSDELDKVFLGEAAIKSADPSSSIIETASKKTDKGRLMIYDQTVTKQNFSNLNDKGRNINLVKKIGSFN